MAGAGSSECGGISLRILLLVTLAAACLDTMSVDAYMEGAEEWSFFQTYMPAGISMRSASPSELSTAATAPEERDPKAPRFEEPKGFGGRGKGRDNRPGSSRDGGGGGGNGGGLQGLKRQGEWGKTTGWPKDDWWTSGQDSSFRTRCRRLCR